MLKKLALGTPALLISLGAVAPALRPLPEQRLKPRDHERLGEDIAAYFAALDESKGISEAFEEIVDAIEKLQKKHKDRDVLSFVEDWEQAFYHARIAEYDDRVPGEGRVEEEEADFNGKKFTIAVHAPKKYSTKSGPYRVVLCVPDAGQSAKEHLTERWMDAAARETTILVAVDMPKDEMLWQIFDPTSATLDGIGTILASYGWAARTYAVDLNRVFLAGTGKGVGAAHAAAAAIPHFFAGFIGWGDGPEPVVTNFSTVPTLLLNGGARATDFHAKLVELGFENCTLANAGTEADAWAWMDGMARDAYPHRLVFSPTTPYTTNAYWVSLAGVDVSEGPRVEARIDPEANSIQLDTKSIGSVSLSLNDKLVDMDRPVKVVANGTESEILLPRNERLMIDLAYRDGDWGRVFTNRHPVEIR